MHPRPFIHGTYYYYYYYYYYYFWLRWVFAAARRLSLVAASGVYSSLQCAGFSLQWFLLLQSPGSRHAGLSSCGPRAQQLWPAGSAAVAHGPSCSVACGIFPDQASNPCPLNWQADSQPLRHQGSPMVLIINRPDPQCSWPQAAL